MISTTFAADPSRSRDFRIIGLVSLAHFVSHVFMLVMPPLFPFLRADFNVSYTELGSAVALFNIVSLILQTPAGFLVDRTSARTVLVGGLLLSGASLVAASFGPGFVAFLVMIAALGVANAVYHPADYALLSSRVSSGRAAQAFSIHTFAGFAGTAMTPLFMLILAASFGWRGAFIGAGLLGIAVALIILLFGGALGGKETAAKRAGGETSGATDWRVLLRLPIILNAVFFMLIAAVSVGMQNYLIVALDLLWGTPLSTSATALTVYLSMGAIAVLVGGVLASRTDRHDLVAIIGLTVTGLVLLPVALFDLGTALLMVAMVVAGFFNGVIHPSRDMIVRAVTPPGAFGRVFGFVTSGFNLGGIIAPPAFGYLMDHGSPRAVMIATALCCLAAIPTVMTAVARGSEPGKTA